MKPVTGLNNVHFHSLVRRQTVESHFSHWTIDDQEFLDRIQTGTITSGYREGVLIVSVKPEGFFSSVIKLKEGDSLCGEFTARREGEEPRIQMYAEGHKIPAKAVDIILYSHTLLKASGDNESDADYEIVSVNARDTEGMHPMTVNTLLANHFGADGGTDTNMSPEEFEAALKTCYNYWKDKVLCKE